MEQGNRFFLRVHQKNGAAIGDIDANRKPGNIRGQAVGIRRGKLRFTVNPGDPVGMHLLGRGHFSKRNALFREDPVVVLTEKLEGLRAVPADIDTGLTKGENVIEPGDGFQLGKGLGLVGVGVDRAGHL